MFINSTHTCISIHVFITCLICITFFLSSVFQVRYGSPSLSSGAGGYSDPYGGGGTESVHSDTCENLLSVIISDCQDFNC